MPILLLFLGVAAFYVAGNAGLFDTYRPSYQWIAPALPDTAKKGDKFMSAIGVSHQTTGGAPNTAVASAVIEFDHPGVARVVSVSQVIDTSYGQYLRPGDMVALVSTPVDPR